MIIKYKCWKVFIALTQFNCTCKSDQNKSLFSAPLLYSYSFLGYFSSSIDTDVTINIPHSNISIIITNVKINFDATLASMCTFNSFKTLHLHNLRYLI